MTKGSQKIPVYKLSLPVKGDKLTLAVGGDFHYGVKGVNKNDTINELKKVLKASNGDILWLWIGDLMENSLKTSVGHGYDLAIPDPQQQKEDVTEILRETMKETYGSEFNKINTKVMSGIRAFGCYGNHEYRTRKQAGLYLDKDIYEPAKIVDVGDQALIELTIYNKKLQDKRFSRKFKIFFKHRPYSTTGTSIEIILRMMRKKMADIPGCDIYAYGHFHKRIIHPEGHFDSDTGEFKKTMYVCTPSPMHNTEYADLAGYSPLVCGYAVNLFLPVDPSCDIYGIV